MNDKTKRMIAAGIAILLVAGLLTSILSGFFMVASAAEVTQSTVDSLRGEINGIASQKKAIQKALSELSAEKKSLLKEKGALEQEAALNQKEIEAATELIGQLGILIQQKMIELENAEANEARQYALFKSRVRMMYEQGSLNYLDVLLEAGSFSEMLSRYEIIAQIMDYDRTLGARLKEMRENISEAKQVLESDKAEEEELKSTLEEKKQNLAGQIAESEAMSAQIESDEATTRKLYEEMEEEEDKLQAELKRQIAELAKKSKYVGGTMDWPLPGHNDISSYFGNRFHPVLKKYKLHTGIDIPAQKGTSILAANDGDVVTSTYTNAWGNYVVVNHGGGVATLYAHMSQRSVSEGAKVKKGDVLGLVGSTGYSTGNHLHFEIIKDGQSVDPLTTEFKKVTS